MKIISDINKIQGPNNLNNVKKKGEVKSNEFENILKNQGTNEAKTSNEIKTTPQISSGIDSVKFSSEAEKVKFVNDIVGKTPEIRQSKVDEIKAKIQKGTYDVSSEKLAQKLIDSGIAEKLMGDL
jgi:negative regulator of flagellin synthesis FlgM